MSELAPDEGLRAVLRASAEVPDLPEAARARMRARLQEAIGSAGVTASAQPNAPTSAVTHAGLSVATKIALGTLAGIVSGIAIGFAVGFVIPRLSEAARAAHEHESAERAVHVLRAPESAAQAAGARDKLPPQSSPELRALPAQAAEPLQRDAAQREGPPRADQEGSTATLAAERRLIDAAFASLRQGNAEEALHALDRHAARFPHGAFAEEREELRARASALANPMDSP